MYQKYLGVLHQSKESIFHSIKELNQTLKANEQKSISDSLANVLSSIATFDEDFIQNSISQYSANPSVQKSLDKIMTKIKQTKEASKNVPLNTQPLTKIQQQPPASTLRVSSQIVRSSSKEKEPAVSLDSKNPKKDGSSGLFGVFGKILGGGNKGQKPKVHQMILPQKQSKAVYDPVKKKWIFQGEEQQPQKQIPKPPPKKQLKLQKSQTSSQQSISKQLKKSVSQIDQMTAPPSFKRRGQTKSVGGTKKITLKQQIIPTTLVQQQTNPLESLMNMIDKEFYKLQECMEELEGAWKREIQRELKVKEMGSGGKEVSEKERVYVEELNQRIREFNQTSIGLMEGYERVREESREVSEFDRELNEKLMKIARDNTIIAHQLSNQDKFSQVSSRGYPSNEQNVTKYEAQIRKLNEEIRQLKADSDTIRRELRMKQDNLKDSEKIISERGAQKKLLEQRIQELSHLKSDNQSKTYIIQQLQQKISNILKSSSQTHIKQARQCHQLQHLIKTSPLYHQLQQTILTKSQAIHSLTNKCNQLQGKNDKLKYQASLMKEKEKEIRELNEILVIKQGQISEMSLKLENSHLAARILQQQKIEEEENLASSERKIEFLMDVVENQKKSKQQLIESNNSLKSQLQQLKSTNSHLTSHNQQLLTKTQQLQHIIISTKLQLQKLQQDKRNFQLILRQHQLIQNQTMKTNLQQLESFAQSIAQESLLLVSIQAKQLELRVHSDRSSDNSSKKSQLQDNQQLSVIQAHEQKSSSSLNISDILTEMTKQYIQKISQMKYQLNEMEQNNKSLTKAFSKEKQKIINQIQSLKKSLNTSLALNQGYKKTRNELEEKISLLQIQNEKIKKKLQLIKKQQLANKQLIQQTLYQKHHHSHELSMLQNNNQSLQNQLQQLQDQLEAKNQELQEVCKQLEDLRCQLEDREDEIREKQIVINRIRASFEEEKEDMELVMEKRETEYRNSLKSKQKELQSLKRQLQLLQQKQQKLIKQHKSTKQSLTQKLHQSQSSKKQLQKQLKSNLSHITKLQQSLAATNNQLSSIKRQLEEERSENERNSGEKERELECVKEQLRVSQEQQSQLHERVSQYIQYSNSLKQNLDSITLEKSFLQTRISQLQQQQHQHTLKLSSLSSQQLLTITKQKHQLQTHLTNTLNIYNQIQTQFYQMKQLMDQKIHYLTHELENSYQSGETLSRQLGAYSELVNKMGEKMERLEIEVRESQLKGNNSKELEKKCKQLEAKHEQEIGQLLESLEEKEKQLQLKDQELKQKQRKINTLSSQNTKKSQELQYLNNQLSSLKTNLQNNQKQPQYSSEYLQLQHLHDSLKAQYQQLSNNYAQIYKIYQDLQKTTSIYQQSVNQIKSRVLLVCQEKFIELSEKYQNQLQVKTQAQGQVQLAQFSLTIVTIVNEIARKYQQVNKQKQQSANELIEVIQQLQHSTNNQQNLQSTITQLTNQLQSLKLSNQSLKLSHQSLCIQNQSLLLSKEQLQQLQQNKTQLQHTQSQLLLMVQALQKENESKTQQINQLQKQLENYKSYYNYQQNQTVPKSQFIELIDKYQKLLNQLEENKNKLVEFEQTKQEKQLLEDENYQLKEEKSIQLRKKSFDMNKNTTLINDHNHNKFTLIDSNNPNQSQQQQPTSNDNQTQQLNEIVIQLSTRLQAAQKDNSRLISQLQENDRLLKQQKMITNALKQKLSQNQLILQTLTNTNRNNQSLIKEKNQTISVKDSIISELSASLQAKQQELRRIAQDKMLSSKDSQSGMYESYNLTQNRDSLKENSDNMYATANSRQPRSDSLKGNNDTEIEELLESMNAQLQERKIKQTQLLEIITQQETQISILKEKYRQLESNIVTVSNKQAQSSLNNNHQIKPQSSEEQVNESHELYIVIEEMQKQIQQKNQQLQQLKLIVDNLDSQVKNTNGTSTMRNNNKSTLSNNEQNSQQQIFTQVSDNLSKLAEQLKIQQQQIKDHEQQVKELRELLKQRDNQIQNQKMYAEILKDKEQEQSAQITQLKQKNQHLHSQLQSLKKTITQLQSTFNQPSSTTVIQQHQQNPNLKIQQLQTLLNNMEQQINSKDQQLLRRANEIHRLKQLQVESNNLVGKLNNEIDRLRNSVGQLEEMLVKVNSQMDGLRNNKKEMQKDVKQKQQFLVLKDQQISTLTQKLSNITIKQPTPQQNVSLSTNKQSQQIKHLKQQILKLQSQLIKHKQQLQNKDDQIQEMTELINSQATDIQKLEDKIKSLDEKLLQTATHYQQQLKSSIVNQELSKVNHQIKEVENKLTFNQQSSTNDQLALVKIQLQQVYQQLRNKKIQVDELRKNLFDVNKFFTQRQSKYQSKIKTLETDMHKYEKTKDAFNKYETSIKELQAQITNLSSEKAEFLRVIENLEKQLLDKEKNSSDKKVLIQGKTDNNGFKPTTQKRQPASENKLRSTRSEIVEPKVEIKPTGFFGSISSLFMTPIETERMAKKIVNK